MENDAPFVGRNKIGVVCVYWQKAKGRKKSRRHQGV